MTSGAYCLFETELGTCGIAWREADDPVAPPVVTLFQLPEGTADRTAARLVRRSGATQAATPPPAIAAVVERVRRHLEGELQDFRDVPVAVDGAGTFARKVYEALRQVPAGQTTTYGELARKAGRPGAARAVGQAMRQNNVALIIPCHRVLAAGGKPGGFSAHGGCNTKARMLAIEGVE
jgi:methylated-DNA-[protein]-cysteine S-methyltransferase